MNVKFFLAALIVFVATGYVELTLILLAMALLFPAPTKR